MSDLHYNVLYTDERRTNITAWVDVEKLKIPDILNNQPLVSMRQRSVVEEEWETVGGGENNLQVSVE